MSNHTPGVGNWARNARELKHRRAMNFVTVGTCPVCGGPGTGKSRWNNGKDAVCSVTCAELARQRQPKEQPNGLPKSRNG